MSKKNESTADQTEALNKSIDALLDEVFSDGDSVSKGSPLDIAGDSKTTADAAVRSAPSSQKDEARGAGRPKQISDVPQNDTDGRRDSEYDASISESKKADEPEETDQSPSIDQTSGKGRVADGSAAPKMAPFKKSVEMTDEEIAEFEAFKKAKVDAAAEVAKAEELKKAEQFKRDQEALIKSAVQAATDKVRKENEELRKSMAETQALVKAMAAQPVRSKSITGIEALEKSTRPEEKSETFSKSEILDAAFELAKSKKISDLVVSEIEMTGSCRDPEARAKIEKYLAGN